MTARRSIARMMGAIIIIGLALAWTRCWLNRETWPGELAPSIILAHVAVALAIVVNGRFRVFCLGLAHLGLVMSVGLWLCPPEFRSAVRESLVLPKNQLCGPPIRSSSDWHSASFDESEWRIDRPFFDVKDHVILTFAQLPIMILGGLLLAHFWRAAGKSAMSLPPDALLGPISSSGIS